MTTAQPIPDGSVIVTPANTPNAPANDEMTMTVGFREVYDTTLKTAGTVESLARELREARNVDEQRREDARRVVDDVEGRLRSLERWKYGIPATGLAAVVGLVWQVRGGG